MVGRESLGYSAGATPAKFIHTCSAFKSHRRLLAPSSGALHGGLKCSGAKQAGVCTCRQPGAAAVVVAGCCSQVQANLAGHLGHLLGDGLALARHKEPAAAGGSAGNERGSECDDRWANAAELWG